ncbi:MAG: hypothetical protein KDE51_24090, partial [Anaerolineales bacterium]|nr:hypothetical protein [Anaerolineales bacterium]
MAFNPRRIGRRHEADADKNAPRLNRESIQHFRRVLNYVKPYRGWMIIAVIGLLVSVALGLIMPWVIQSLVDFVLVDKDLQMLNRLGFTLLLVFIIQAVFTFIHRLAIAFVGERAIADIRI